MWRQLGIAHRVLDVLVAEIGLQGPRIVPGIGQGEAASVPQRVWVGLAASPARSTSLLKPRPGERRATRGCEHEW